MHVYDEALRSVIDSSYPVLCKSGARTACIHAMRLLEDEALFNAGYGSKLQRDGTARMSAAFMDGRAGRFSGVINVENVRHPIDIAQILNRRKHTVLAGQPAELFARSEQIPAFDPVTPHRLKEHQKRKRGETGTCGVVALGKDGRICVATSTGGIGYEVPGRVGDSPTVAGNYASSDCGVSCTGIGEHIINLAVAAKVSARVEDGQALGDVVDRLITEGNERSYRFGMIALDQAGCLKVGQTRNVTVLAAWHDGESVGSFLK